MRRLFALLVGMSMIAALGVTAGAAEHARAPQRLAGRVQDSLGRPVTGADVW